MPSLIALAAEAPSVYTAARFYERMGFSVIPCNGKKPALRNWSHLQQRTASRETIDLWHKTGLLENVGIICGRVSGGLVVMDLDGDAAISAYFERFPDMDETYAVTSGSRRGLHVYYYVRDVPPTTRVTGLDVGNIELRSDGAYVVAPPSVHPDTGKSYIVSDNNEIRQLYDMRLQVEWIKSLIREKHGGHMPPPSNASNGTIRNATAYGLTALQSEAADVARALPGERNERLYRAALKMGSLIADGKIERARVESALVNAAAPLTNSDGETATRKTIASGIDQGLMSSRSAWRKDA